MFKKLKWSDYLFGVFILLLLIPQTRKPIQVALNKARVYIISPDAIAVDNRIQIRPFDYRVQTLDGAPKRMAIAKGKVTFLSYWATWCPPCIAELPSIAALYKDYGNQVNFLLLTNEEPEVVNAFLAKKGYELPVFIARMKAPEQLYETSIPTNYVIDQNGNVIIKETGASNWNSKTVRLMLDALLK